MIDRKSFSKEWIESISDVPHFGGQMIVERTIYAFYLLEKITKSHLDVNWTP